MKQSKSYKIEPNRYNLMTFVEKGNDTGYN